jgi:P-type Ca2+ transporter type 2B
MHYQICFFCVETGKEFVDALLICIAILVMAVPEGLPLAVTLTLAYSVGKMKDENNLVRQIQSRNIINRIFFLYI